MRYDLSQQDIQQVIDFANGENDAFINSPKAVEFMNLAYQFQHYLMKMNREQANRIVSVTKRLERYADKDRKALIDGSAFSDFDEDHIFIVAKAVCFLLQTHNVLPTVTKVMAFTYMLYSAWLQSHRQRVIKDTPVSGKYGPVFWRLKNWYDKDKNRLIATPDDFEQARKIADGGVAACLQHVINNNYRVSDLPKRLLETKPFKEALNRPKQQLRDSDIYAWQTERNEQRKAAAKQ